MVSVIDTPQENVCGNSPARTFLSLVGVLLATTYLLLLPPGIKGLLLALAGLACTVVKVNRVSLAVYLLLLGPLLLGSLCRCAGVSQVGTLLAYGLAFVLLSVKKTPISSAQHINMRRTFAWWLLTIWVLVVSYIYGPMTSYSTHKLLFFVFRLSVVAIAFYHIVLDKKVDLFAIGVFAFAAAAAHYASIGYRIPSMMPSSVFEPTGLRMHMDFSADSLPENNVLAFMATSSVLMILGSAVDKKLTAISFLKILIVSALGVAMVLSSGQRTWMLGLFVGAVSIVFTRPRNRLSARLVGIFTAVIVMALIVVAVTVESKLMAPIVEGIKHDEGRLVELIGRDENFDSAVNRISERPLLGHGLGGYYVDWYSEPGGGTYPHNLLLELLCETGIIGTMIILITPIYLFIIPAFRKILHFRTESAVTILPLLIMWVMTSMASWDLTFSAGVFAIVGILWATFPRRYIHTDSQAWWFPRKDTAS